MCLKAITGIPVKKFGTGYKVFQLENGILYSQFFAIGKKIIQGKWLNEVDYRYDRVSGTINEGLISYPTGWHLFPRKKDAIRWACGNNFIIKEVKYRKAHTVGMPGCRKNRYKTIVAKEIFILPGEVK